MTKTPHFHRIIVTGSNGRLGRILRGAATLADRKDTMMQFAARSGPSDLPAFSAGAVPATLPPADLVVALWGVTSGTPSELAQNADLAQASVAVARACGAPRLLHLSSAAIYGPGTDMAEHDAPNPANPYGQAKLALEARVADLSPPGLHQCCLRLANVLGADSLAPALLSGADEPATLTRFADGRGPLRSYIPPGLLYRVLCGLAALPPADLPPVLNVAAHPPVEMEALLRATGKHIIWKEPPPGDRQHVTLSTTRLAALLPALDLHMTAPDMIQDWRAALARMPVTPDRDDPQ